MIRSRLKGLITEKNFRKAQGELRRGFAGDRHPSSAVPNCQQEGGRNHQVST